MEIYSSYVPKQCTSESQSWSFDLPTRNSRQPLYTPENIDFSWTVSLLDSELYT